MKIEATEKIRDVANRAYTGRPVARGTGLGRVLSLIGTKRQFFETRIAKDMLGAEIERFRDALSKAESQLRAIIDRSEDHEGRAGIFETHLLFLQDKSLIRKIELTITENKVNSEWAVAQVVDEYVSKYKLLSDKHLREKYIDLEDIGERLISALGGNQSTSLKLQPETVVVAKELNPTTLIEIAEQKPVALVTENGGWTSHTFILARELGIPAVTGIRKLLRRIETGDRIFVDGYSGEIVVNPTPDVAEAKKARSDKDSMLGKDGPDAVKPVMTTLDGVEIRLCANLDFSAVPPPGFRVADFGIGLYRSEYLFNRYSGYPSEEAQIKRYREVVELAGGSNVKVRSFDLNTEEISGGRLAREKNPALGTRGMRLSLRDRDQFRTQIRALLVAGAGGNLDIVFPMVSDLEELEIAISIVREEHRDADQTGDEDKLPGLGVMIEVPSAVFMIDEILDVVDFINVGTNDLVQYLLAADRDNDDVAESFQTLHPAVGRALGRIFSAAASHGKEAVVCGEMAGSPLYVPYLIGLGARTLSMNINSIQRVGALIANISEQECATIANEVKSTRTSSEAEKTLMRLCAENWPHIPEYAGFIEKSS